MIRQELLDMGMASLSSVTPGMSEDADQVQVMQPQAKTHSPSITREAREQAFAAALKRIFIEAGQPNWDGYGALPVSVATLKHVGQFFYDLPPDVMLPEVGADPDGDISLDWDFGNRNVFSVSVARDGTLQFAGLFGHETYHGSAVLRQGIPKAVAEGIYRAIRTAQY